MQLKKYEAELYAGGYLDIDEVQAELDKAHAFYQEQVNGADLKPSEEELKRRFKAASDKILAGIAKRSGRT